VAPESEGALFIRAVYSDKELIAHDIEAGTARMDFAELEVFTDVARAGSFASVARHRATDPSAISRIVAALEDELGTRLFHRTTRSMTLTEGGQRFLQRAEALLEDFAAARAEALDAADVPSGVIRLTASVGFAQVCIVPLLPELCERYPHLVIDLVATDAVLDLPAEGIDLAVRLAPRPDGDYVASLLRPTRYHVVASPDFARRYQPQHPEDLARMPAVVFPLRGFKSRWLFRDPDGVVSEVAIEGRVQASSSIALRDLAQRGVGTALLGDWLVERDLERGDLVDLFPHLEVTATEFETAAWLLYPSRKFLPAKTRAVIDFLREKLGR
jgi:DNA-binding transcriptional LysR family regulator